MKQLLFSILTLFSLPFFAMAEEISSFTADIYLNRDGTFDVTETIEYDFGGENRHGIFRTLEKKHPQGASSFWKERTIDIQLDDVTRNGEAVPFEVSDGNEELYIKIGDPDATISGVHTYEIAYKVTGGYAYFEDGTAEIYWNVNGNEWNVPIASAVAQLHAEPSLWKEQRACYAGPLDSVTSCDEVVAAEDVVSFSASLLAPYSGLTVAQALDGTQIDHVVIERFNTVLLAFIVIPLTVVSLVIFGYRYRMRFKTGNPVIAQYEPYENFKPMYSGMLLDGVLDPRDITAGIVYLAEQGFLKIKKTEQKVLFLFEVDDYAIELLRPLHEVESAYLKDVLTLLFSETAGVHEMVTLSSLKTDLSKQQKNALTLQQLRKDLKNDMRKEGFYQVRTTFLKPLFAIVILFFVLLFFMDLLASFAPAAFIVYIFAGLACALTIFLIMYERRTRKGFEAQDHLKGFKLFLGVTDTERFTFHNAPQKSPEQFMEYLPYAIAFGVEKQWAKAFEAITIPNPDWYDGGSVGTFSAVNLTSSLGAFSTSFTTSSGSSGSSGGGSSGGGGGGGGGGSW